MIDEHRMLLWKVLEYRNGQVFKTEKIGMVWVPDSIKTLEEEEKFAKSLGGDLLSSLPTSFTSKAPYSECYRRH